MHTGEHDRPETTPRVPAVSPPEGGPSADPIDQWPQALSADDIPNQRPEPEPGERLDYHRDLSGGIRPVHCHGQDHHYRARKVEADYDQAFQERGRQNECRPELHETSTQISEQDILRGQSKRTPCQREAKEPH